MKEKLNSLYLILKRAITNAMDHDIITYAAAIAFYTIFSLPGLLITAITTASIFLGHEAVTGELSSQLQNFIGPDGAQSIEVILRNIELKGDGAIETVIAIGVLLFSATTVFVTLQEALNVIWKIEKKPKSPWYKQIINRVLSLGMVVSLGFLLLVSLIIDTVLSIAMGTIENYMGEFSATLLNVVSFCLSTGLVILLIALIFKVLPDKKTKWKEVWIGSIITGGFFIFGKYLIELYVTNSDFSATYDAAGSLIVVLVWVYYSTLLVLFGGEITQSLSASKTKLNQS